MAEYIARFPAIPVAIAALKGTLDEKRPGKWPNLGISDEYSRIDQFDYFIRVGRPGGSMTNLVTDAPTMLFECFVRRTIAPNAEKLALDVDSALKAMQFGTFLGAKVRYWRGAGIAALDDPDKPAFSRWQVTGTLALSVDNSH